MVVDLPAPLGPSSANTSPLWIPKVRFSTAVTLPKDLVRWRTRRPSFVLLTLSSSSPKSSSGISAAEAVVDCFCNLLYQATTDPLSYQRSIAKRTNICTIKYKIGPPYHSNPAGC